MSRSARETDWTPERESRLRTLWDEGHTSVAIGAAMGMTKNAVLGKVHRLKLTPRPSPIPPRGDGTRPDRPEHAPVPRLPALASLKDAPVVRIVAEPAPSRLWAPAGLAPVIGTLQCSWIDGDKPDWRYCEDRAVKAQSYCLAHCERAYRPRIAA